MTHRRSYRDEPALADEVFALLGRVFPDEPLGRARLAALRFGAPWESASTPYLHRVGGGLVSHVGLLALDVMIGDRPWRVGGVHAVATDPAHRRRGHYRRIMAELLADADRRFEGLLLTTLHPEYFRDFGFRVVPEWTFRAEVAGSGGELASRVLDLETASDRAVIHRLLERRAPLSPVLSLGREKCVWAFYEAVSPLRFVPALDLVMVAEQGAGGVVLHDVIASRLPPLGDLLAAWPEPVGSVEARFSPEHLDPRFRPAPLEPSEGDGTVLMARGPLPLDGRPLRLGRGGRC